MTSGTPGPGPTREARVQRARAWLRYAARDLAAARDALRPGSRASPYHAAFWAQQATEKALKGPLTYVGVRFEDTHRLNVLASLLPTVWETRRAAGMLGELTRYGVETRYPDLGEAEPTADDARRAVDQAESISAACDVTLRPMASHSSRHRHARGHDH